jgi:hypothetical protein
LSVSGQRKGKISHVLERKREKPLLAMVAHGKSISLPTYLQTRSQADSSIATDLGEKSPIPFT